MKHKDPPPREPAFSFKTKDLRIAPRSKTKVGNFENLSGDWDGLVRGLKNEIGERSDCLPSSSPSYLRACELT